MGLFSKKHNIESFGDILSELADYDNAGVELLPEEYFTLGYICLKQKQGIKVSEYWLRKAYRLGHPGSIKLLYDLAVEKNAHQLNEESISLLKEGVSLGNRPCMTAYGILLTEGHGVVKDEQRGKDILQLAADMGDLTAAAVIGEAYLRGDLLEKNYDLAKYWLIKAAVRGYRNDGVDQYLRSLLSEEELDQISNDNYFEFYRKAADAGCADAMYYMYLTLFNGFHIQKDEKIANEFLSQAADLGHVIAISTQAANDMNLIKSPTGNIDIELANKIAASIQKGTEIGEPLSYVILGDMYYLGYLGDDEYEKAYMNYHQATSRINLSPCASIAQMISYSKYLPSEELSLKGRQDINTLHSMFFANLKGVFEEENIGAIC